MSRSGKRIVVVTPALDEERAIPKVIQAVPDWVDVMVVVDNGSTDATAAVAAEAGARVVAVPEPGYGRACLRGIAEARRLGADVIVFLDGDYSDYPEHMDRLVDPILEDRADFVLGSRTRGRLERGAMLPQQRFGNWLAGQLLTRFWGVEATDMGPFRAIRTEALERLGMQDQTYGWTVEMQVKAAEAGLRCLEVPVDYRRRIGVSKVTGTVSGTVKASAKILWLFARYGLTRGSRSYPKP